MSSDMFILRIEYRLNGEKKIHVEYTEFNKLEEAIEMRKKWLRLFTYDFCSIFDASIYERMNY